MPEPIIRTVGSCIAVTMRRVWAAEQERLRRELTQLQEESEKALRDINGEVLMLGGGLPIEIGGDVVGGIGVGGAPGTHLDDACAQGGLDAIGAVPKVAPAK